MVMGLSNSPKIATNGLVFAYDSNNIKSYKGPPLTNKTQYLNTYNNSGTGYSFVGDTEEAYIPSLGITTVKTVKIQNNYPSVSDWCCPAPVQHADGFVVSPSTVYTYFILYKIESGYTHPNYMYRYEYTASGGSYVTEQGVHSDSNRTYLGDGWYYAWGTFTTNASTNWIGFCGSFYYRYSTSYDKFWVAKSAIIEGNWAGMHPKYWPSPGETRSNTQSLRDLTGNYILTINSLTYNSTGAFSFAGSHNIDLNSNNIITGNNPFTIESWTNKTSGSYGAIFGNYGSGYTSGTLWFATAGLYISGSVYHSDYSTTMAGIHHSAVTRNSNGDVKLYRDGVLVNTGTLTASIPAQQNFRIGTDVNGTGEALYGDIYNVKVYNRELSESEIKQNFAAQRGLYGI
jgi:hypothetical protein